MKTVQAPIRFNDNSPNGSQRDRLFVSNGSKKTIMRVESLVAHENFTGQGWATKQLEAKELTSPPNLAAKETSPRLDRQWLC
jgi:hypothetical protein